MAGAMAWRHKKFLEDGGVEVLETTAESDGEKTVRTFHRRTKSEIEPVIAPQPGAHVMIEDGVSIGPDRLPGADQPFLPPIAAPGYDTGGYPLGCPRI